jgi:predicted metal-binding membrane protein
LTATTLDRLVRRDRLLIASVLGALTCLSWIHMITMAGQMTLPARFMPCCGAHFGLTLAMWVVMMAGMMIPSVMPMVFTHAAIVRRRAAGGAGSPLLLSALFLGGYLLAWSGFSVVAAVFQWALYHGVLLDGHTLRIAPFVGGIVLVAAGAFQLSGAKDACLSQCRAPLGYFVTEWRDGMSGAAWMGLRHGVFCIGCCWLLMAVLFAVGIMNVLWGAAITAFVLAEKVLPWRRLVVWSGAAICVVAGLGLMGQSTLGN